MIIICLLCLYETKCMLQINHKYEDTNGEFIYLTHPIYGNIRGVASTRLIKRGEEIFEDYSYDTSYEDTPRWYLDGLQDFKNKE